MSILKDLMVNIVAGVILEIGLILLAIFAPNVSIFLRIQTNYIQLIALILIIIVLVLVVRIIIVHNQVHKPKIFSAVKRRPRYIKDETEITHFGVKWIVKRGALFRGDFIDQNYYSFAEEPFCPTCNYQLDSMVKKKWLGLAKKSVWHCGRCNKDYDRPRDYLYEENQTVEKLNDSEF